MNYFFDIENIEKTIKTNQFYNEGYEEQRILRFVVLSILNRKRFDGAFVAPDLKFLF